MWERILKLEGVVVREIEMPQLVWGKQVKHVEHSSDLARVGALFEEGGIYFDTDMLALKSADDIIYAPTTASTIMARQEIPPNAVSNAMIMSKPGSPFLKRWMERYRDFDPDEWDHTSCQVPVQMWDDGDPDLTLLDKQSFLYPMQRDPEEMRSFPYLAQMWIGKSWWDVERSYGVHMWKWGGKGTSKREVEVSPEVVRSIDTPIFCRMRDLFDDVDGDGYVSVPWREDRNCSVTWVRDLDKGRYGLFADWRMRDADVDIKWVDSSGYHLHGFAPKGTALVRSDNGEGKVVRRFEAGSYAWLPVPSDWDVRVGTVRMVFQLDDSVWKDDRREEMGLFKIRLDWTGELVISLKFNNDAPTPEDSIAYNLHFQWFTQYLARDQYAGQDDVDWLSEHPLHLSKSSPNELALSFDRKTNGTISTFLDKIHISSGTLPLIASSKIAGEIWMNVRNWPVGPEQDMGFRGDLHRLEMFADVVPAEILTQDLSNTLGRGRDAHSAFAPIVVGLIISLLFALLARYWLRRRSLLPKQRWNIWSLNRSLPSKLDKLKSITEVHYRPVADQDRNSSA